MPNLTTTSAREEATSNKIQVQNVSHVFSQSGQRVLALDRVSFDVPEGSFLSIVGPSGCGKTTLLRIIHGLIRPSRGTVLVNRKVITSPTPEMAMVFQDHNLLPWRTVIRNVEIGLELAGVPATQRRERAIKAIQMVGLTDFTRAYPFQLSGGMRQRVGLARGLCLNPQIFFMDEPFGALDAQTRQLMQFQLLEILQQQRVTVVFVTHDIEEAVYLSDRVLVMSARPGRIKTVVDIDLPKERAAKPELRMSAAVMEYRRYIWDLLRPEMAAMR